MRTTTGQRFGHLAIATSMVLGCAAPSHSSAPISAPPSPPAHASAPAASTEAAVPSSPRSGPLVEPGEPWIVYQGWAGDTTHIGLMRPDGSDTLRLSVAGLPSADLAHPAWSPNGDRIAFDVFFADPELPDRDRVEPWSARPDGSDGLRLATCTLPCLQLAYPTWSPDGRSVALVRYDVLEDGAWGPSALEVLDMASGVRRVLAETADGTSAYYYPRWSPDGRTILVAVETYADLEQTTLTGLALGTIKTDGTEDTVSLITPADVLAREGDWDPTGAHIVLTRVDDLVADMEHARLAVLSVDGSEVRSLTSASGPGGGAFHPSWGSDDDRITFVHVEPSGARRIARIRSDGTDMELVAVSGEVRTHPRMRPTP